MQNYLKALTVALMLAGAACSKSPETPDVPKVVSLQAASCEKFISTLPADYEHGYVETPEIPGDDASPRLKIFYAYRAPLRGRITLFLNGGPGGSVHSSRRLMDAATAKFGHTDDITFVYMDQRGNGCSSEYPDAPTDTEIFERAKWYGTRGIVADAEVLRRKLVGDKPWSILGQSYGAMIAHRYAVIAPDSLDRVVAYANTITADPVSRFQDRLFSQIDIWEEYFKVYPQDRAALGVLMKLLPLSYCQKVNDTEVCGYEFIDPLVSSYLGFKDEWPLLNRWIHRMTIGDRVIPEQLKAFATAFDEPTSHSRSRSLNAVNAYDRNILGNSGVNCQRVKVVWEAAHPGRLFSDALTECSLALEIGSTWTSRSGAVEYFNGRRDLLTKSDLQAVLSRKPKNFFLLYSGTLDPYVPERSFAEEVAVLGDLATYVNFPNAGHEGFYTEPQVLTDLLAQ